jgi:hypothetical protein
LFDSRWSAFKLEIKRSRLSSADSFQPNAAAHGGLRMPESSRFAMVRIEAKYS